MREQKSYKKFNLGATHYFSSIQNFIVNFLNSFTIKRKMYVKKKEDGRNYDFDYLLLTYTSSYEFSLESIKFKNIRNERLRRGKKNLDSNLCR